MGNYTWGYKWEYYGMIYVRNAGWGLASTEEEGGVAFCADLGHSTMKGSSQSALAAHELGALGQVTVLSEPVSFLGKLT